MVCIRTPHPSRPGARRAAVQTVKARMNTIRVLGRQLKNDGIEIVTLESTSDYWRIWFFVLEAAGLVVQLVSPAEDRQAGRAGAGPADRVGDAAGLVRAAQGDPGPAGLHPGPGPAGPRADPLLAAAGEAAGRRPGQGLQCRLEADHRVRPGHDQGDDRRPARPAGAGRPGPGPDESQARRP